MSAFFSKDSFYKSEKKDPSSVLRLYNKTLILKCRNLKTFSPVFREKHKAKGLCLSDSTFKR